MKRALIRFEANRSIYIHNDLDSTAFHFAQIIRAKLDSGDRDGIGFDAIACATMIAFSFEAYLNFFGHKLVADWKERQGTGAKIEQVFSVLKIAPDWQSRPYISVQAMKVLRDTFAHGKPVEVAVSEEREALVGEVDGIRADLSAAWERQAEPELVLQAHDDLNVVWKEMLQASGLELFDAMTHGSHGFSLVRMLDAPPEG